MKNSFVAGKSSSWGAWNDPMQSAKSIVPTVSVETAIRGLLDAAFSRAVEEDSSGITFIRVLGTYIRKTFGAEAVVPIISVLEQAYASGERILINKDRICPLGVLLDEVLYMQDKPLEASAVVRIAQMIDWQWVGNGNDVDLIIYRIITNSPTREVVDILRRYAISAKDSVLPWTLLIQQCSQEKR
jgi:hypothetical protein